MKAVIINSYGGAEVLQYADIETPQIKSDQQRLSLDCNCSEVVFSSSRIVLSCVHSNPYTQAFCKFIASVR